MSGGEGVRNPADLTPILNLLDGIAFWQAIYFNWILDELEDIDTAIETNRLLLLVIQAGIATVIDDIETLEDHILIALGDVADTIDAVLVDTQLLIGRLTADRAGYLDELGPTNLPSDVDDLLSNVAATAHHVDSRTRVYPQDVRNTISLTCAGVANTFGAWTQIVPIDTIGFCYKVVGVVVEETDAIATYCIQLGYSTDAGTDPTTAQIMGERRLRLIGAPLKLEKEILDIMSFDAPTNAKLWGRVKSSSGATDTVDVSVVIIRHVPVTNQAEPLATWPWA